MKYDNFIKKLKRRLGEDIGVPQKGSRKTSIVFGDTILSWHVEPDGDVRSFHTRGVDQQSCPHSDYYPGTWWDNATQMLDHVCPPPPKFAPGQYVRFKDTKRNTKQGMSGKSDLVTEVNSPYSVVLMNLSVSTHPVWGQQKIVFREKDLELLEQ